MTTETEQPLDITDRAVDKIFDHFSVLAEAGVKGRVAAERMTHRLTVPFTGKQMEGITILSNLPYLPYEADPIRVVQHATVNWLYALSATLRTKDDRVKRLHRSYEWDLNMRTDYEEREQLQQFTTWLKVRAQELTEGSVESGPALYQIVEQVEGAPSDRLRMRCGQAVALESAVVKAVNSLHEEHPLKEKLVSWMEGYV